MVLITFYSMGCVDQSASTTESDWQIKFPKSGVISKLYVRVSFFGGTNGAAVIVSRINGVDGNLTVTIPEDASGEFEDNLHSDVINAGDYINMQNTLSDVSSLIMSLNTVLFTYD